MFWWCEPVIITTCRVMRGRARGSPSQPGSSNSAQNSSPRRSSRIGRPATASTTTPSKSARTDSSVATWVIVRWNDACHVSYCEGWHPRQVRDET